MNGYNWELFNLTEDPTQTDDLSAQDPDRLRNMQELWLIDRTNGWTRSFALILDRGGMRRAWLRGRATRALLESQTREAVE